MIKNKYLILLLSLAISAGLMMAAPARADDVCSWQKLTANVSYNNGATLSGTLGGNISTDMACPNNGTATSTSICTSAKPSGINIGCCCINVNSAQLAQQIKPETIPQFIMPNFQINIPGLDQALTATPCVDDGDGGTICTVPWISQYIFFIYKYSLSFIAILAAIMIMIAGLLWIVSGGDASRITKAKQMIAGSLTGLLLMVSVNILLNFINPDLINQGALKISYISGIDGDSNVPITINQDQIAKVLGVNCGTDSISDIVNKSKGKVTYNQDYRTQSGPNGTIYLDCSSFAAFVRQCSKLSNVGDTSAAIFSDHTVFNGNVNSLKPGDLIGWPPDANPNGNSGHVVIYLGNNKFGDCHGGTGRQPGKAISSTLTMTYLEHYITSGKTSNLYIKR
jgi:hypothetical protein